MKKAFKIIPTLLLLGYGVVLTQLKVFKRIGPFGETPLQHQRIVERFLDHTSEIGWNPFGLLRSAFTDTPELLPVVFFNLLLFVPVGFLLAFCLPTKKWWPSLLLVAILSVILNVVSFRLRYSFLDMGDVLVNILGGMLGWAFAALAMKVREKREN